MRNHKDIIFLAANEANARTMVSKFEFNVKNILIKKTFKQIICKHLERYQITHKNSLGFKKLHHLITYF